MPVKSIQRAQAVERARVRRVSAAQARLRRDEWFIKERLNEIQLTLWQRIRIAVMFVKTKVVLNISKPVTRGISARTGRVVVIERSKPGEYPRADTTLLMKSIFTDTVKTSPGVVDGFIGSPVWYGLVLETKLDRRFLTRTLFEQQDRIRQILSGPIK